MQDPAILVTVDESPKRSAQPDDRLMHIIMAITGGALKAYLTLPSQVRQVVHSMKVRITMADDGISPIELTSTVSLTMRMDSGSCDVEKKYPLSLDILKPEQLYNVVQGFFMENFIIMVNSLESSAKQNLCLAENLARSMGVRS